MTLRIDRRSLVLTGTLGLGALAIPGFALARESQGFTHSVAAGEPAADSLLFWTRYVPIGAGAAKLRVEVSQTADFARVVAGGEAVTGPWRDHTVKITVAGLIPGTRYHYRFVAPDGTKSPIGRASTLPQGDVKRFRIGIFSCSNLAFGYFNAYAHAARRDDLDLAIHLGDYIYEYGAGVYPAVAEQIAARLPEPAAECLHLADYRLRYASYRSDPDLQALHASVAMLVLSDDHETADNSWEGGAVDHQPDEGEWNARKAAGMQAWREWMPVDDEPYAPYEIGTLATFFRTDTRVIARTEQPDIAPAFKAKDVAKALAEFRDGPWMDPAATMMGSTQENWLTHAIAQSVRAGQRWQVVGFGTIMGNMVAPQDAPAWLKSDIDTETRQQMTAAAIAAKAGLPLEFDNWGGYPAARARFLKSAQAVAANLIVVCGDSHNAWAFDLAQDGRPAGVEFAGQAVTSTGFESAFGADPRTVAAGLIAASPELKWCDTSRRGYMTLTLTPERVSNDWVFMDTVAQRSTKASAGHSATAERGRNVMG